MNIDYIFEFVNDLIETGKRNAKGEIYADCPECGGKKDFSVNADKGVYHCFKCDLAGKVSKVRQSDAKMKAAYMLENSEEVKSHPYLEKKKIKAYEGVRLYKELLIIPMYNNGSVKSVQTIDSGGNKKFLSGTKKKGCYFKIQGNKEIYLCEGYATGASIHEATGGTVFVAFDSGNLESVLAFLHKNQDNIVICADNDYMTPGNPGLTKAKKAALKYDDVSLVYPEGITGTDFNDMAIERGFSEVKERIASAEIPEPEPGSYLPYCFWYEKEGRKGRELCVSHSKIILFLEDRGFRNTKHNDRKIIVRIDDNIVDQVDLDDIRNLILNDFFDELPEQISENYTKEDLREVLTKGINVYVQSSKIETMKRIKLNLLQDTKDKTFFFFENAFVELSAAGAENKPYSELDGMIWKSSIRNHVISEESETSDYSLFLSNVCTSSKHGFDRERFHAVRTMQGYLLNGYNNPAYPRAVILTDGNLEESPEGGTGKGIIYRAVGHMRELKALDGKALDFDRPFTLQNVEMDTRLIVFEDVKKGFNFEMFFSGITEGYEVEQKFEKRYKFDRVNNPKTVITTNYAVGGAGNSHERRKFEFELYPYYDKTHTPEDDFGMLFESWNEKQWNDFYVFMFDCVIAYHQNGNRIATYHSDTLETKKLMHAVGMSFVEFADNLPRDEEIVASEAFEKFKSVISKREADRLSQTAFGLKLKKYCDVNGLRLEKSQKRIGKDNQKIYILNNNSQ